MSRSRARWITRHSIEVEIYGEDAHVDRVSMRVRIDRTLSWTLQRMAERATKERGEAVSVQRIAEEALIAYSIAWRARGGRSGAVDDEPAADRTSPAVDRVDRQSTEPTDVTDGATRT